LRHQLVVILGAERIDEINLSTDQAKHLDVSVLLDVETDGADVGQWTAGVVVLPIVWIAIQ
jgi:hypothetical protein